MAEIIRMPRLSDTMEEGVVSAWLFEVGDEVKEGDVLAEIETDKATQEFESEFDGVLLHKGSMVGEALPVDSLFAIIGKKDEEISSLISMNETVKEEADAKEENQLNFYVIDMPLLSDTMKEGRVVSWLKKVGDKVKEGDIIAEIETDKAVQEFESEYDGFLLHIGTEEGSSIPVNTTLAIIGEKGADVKSFIESKNTKNKQVSVEASDATPIIEKLEIVSEEEHLINNNERVLASPLAKKLAKEKNINLSNIVGSGPNGRVVKKDVDSFSVEKPKSNRVLNSPLVDKIVEHTAMRKIVAERLSTSKSVIPHYYLSIELDMSSIINARANYNELNGVKTTFNDWIVKAIANAIEKHPSINVSWDANHIQYHSKINVGIAVSVEGGLMVPVIKEANSKDLISISSEIKDKAVSARDRKIQANEMQGSTVTVSNLGAYGIDFFTSIINQPNACIFSIGAITKKPIVRNGVVEIGDMMSVSMACDHRLIDGVTGSEYLKTLKKYLETPVLIFA